MRTGRRTDMKKLIVAFRNFMIAPIESVQPVSWPKFRYSLRIFIDSVNVHCRIIFMLVSLTPCLTSTDYNFHFVLK
jgi:hypothetical protein